MADRLAIPRNIVRTVPEARNAEAEDMWRIAQAVNPGYGYCTMRDPVRRDLFPLTSDHWDSCTSGAQMAGLIRLEAIWILGGIYIDSDFECYRPFAPLLHEGFFAGWEDDSTVPDFIFGAYEHHPVIRELIGAAITALPQGAWASGPGVFTALLPGHADVTLLPPVAFAPYHYSERHRRYEDHKQGNPDAYGAHHWAASWLKGGAQ